jgi:hypothetical protein
MLEILKATKKKLPSLKPCESYITFRGVNALRSWSMVKNNVLEMTPSKTKEDARQKDRRAVRRISDGG